MGFRALRVINDDRVAAGQGFGTHPHRDMEIISYVSRARSRTRTRWAPAAVIRPGDVQRMSAGTGVRHSEFNASKTEPVHFLQIWILPDKHGIAPGYEQKTFTEPTSRGACAWSRRRDGRDGSVTIHADARVYAGIFGAGESRRARARRQAPRLGARRARQASASTARSSATATAPRSPISGWSTLRGTAAGGELLVFNLA